MAAEGDPPPSKL